MPLIPLWVLRNGQEHETRCIDKVRSLGARCPRYWAIARLRICQNNPSAAGTTSGNLASIVASASWAMCDSRAVPANVHHPTITFRFCPLQQRPYALVAYPNSRAACLSVIPADITAPLLRSAVPHQSGTFYFAKRETSQVAATATSEALDWSRKQVDTLDSQTNWHVLHVVTDEALGPSRS